MNYKQYTLGSMEVLAEVQQLTIKNKHEEMRSAHLMLALLNQKNGFVSRLFSKIGVDSSSLKSEIDDILKSYPSGSNLCQVYTSNKFIELTEKSRSIANSMKDEHIQVEHLLLAVIETRGDLNKTLKKFNINKKVVLGAIRELRGNPEVALEDTDNSFQILDKYTTDLTDLAANSKLHPEIEHDAEIQKTIEILLRNTENNPIFIARQNFKQTAIVEELAIRIIQGNVPENLKNKRIVTLNSEALNSDAKHHGGFENLLYSVLKEIAAHEDIILFIDKFYSIVGNAGEETTNTGDLLKYILVKGELRFIAATTLDEYKKYIEKDSAWRNIFQSITLLQNAEEDTTTILEERIKHSEIVISALFSAGLVSKAITQSFISGVPEFVSVGKNATPPTANRDGKISPVEETDDENIAPNLDDPNASSSIQSKDNAKKPSAFSLGNAASLGALSLSSLASLSALSPVNAAAIGIPALSPAGGASLSGLSPVAGAGAPALTPGAGAVPGLSQSVPAAAGPLASAGNAAAANAMSNLQGIAGLEVLQNLQSIQFNQLAGLANSISNNTQVLGQSKMSEMVGAKHNALQNHILSSINKKANAIANDLQKITNSAAKDLHHTLDKIADKANSIAKDVQSFRNSVASKINDFQNKILDDISKAANTIVNKVPGVKEAAHLIQKVSDIQNNIISKIDSTAKTIVNKIPGVKEVTHLAHKLNNFGENIVAKVNNTINNALDQVPGAREAIEAGKNYLKNQVENTVIQYVADVIEDAVSDLVEEAADALAEALAPVIDAVEEAMAPVMEAIEEAMAPVVEAIEEAMAPVIEAVEEALAPVVEAVDEAVTAVVDAVEEALAPVVEAIDEAVCALEDAIDDAICAVEDAIDIIIGPPVAASPPLTAGPASAPSAPSAPEMNSDAPSAPEMDNDAPSAPEMDNDAPSAPEMDNDAPSAPDMPGPASSNMHVCSGTMLKCSCGTVPTPMQVLPENRTMTSNMPAANIMDNKPIVNILPFGMCTNPANPQVASATAAACGALTPMPCVPNTGTTPWVPGSQTSMVGGQPALHNKCKLMCLWEGVIGVAAPDQVTETI